MNLAWVVAERLSNDTIKRFTAGLDKAKDINASRFYEDPTTGGASEDEQEMVKGFYEEQG